jgi:hypothetical protein
MKKEYIQRQIENPSIIDNFHRYQWFVVDNFDFLIPAEKILDMNHYASREILDKLSINFSKAGWQGDGIIYMMWLPPFLSEDFDDCWGEYVWFVKQNDNGFSFLLSENELNFKKLLEQQD